MNKDITKKILKIFVFILLISYVLDKIIFFSLNKISDQVFSGQAIGKLNHFLLQKDVADVLVFGSSRANHHINVAEFSDNAFNIGVDGTGIAYSSTLISTLPKEKEQLIIVHIDFSNFFGEDYDGTDIGALKSKYHRNDEITQSLDKYGHISILQIFFYSMSYNKISLGIIKNYFKPNYNYKTYNGYDPLTLNLSQEPIRDILLLRAKNSSDKECSDSLIINTVGLDFLKTIKSFSEKSPNKKFLFISSPTYNDVCDNDNEELSKIMKKLGLTYWDFSKLYIDRPDNSYWKDPTHLSKIGAEDFTFYLLQKLEKSNIHNNDTYY